jgi:hypothetical protein
VGDWSRVEGTPDDPNPNKPFAKMENNPLFNSAGKGGSARKTAKYFKPQVIKIQLEFYPIVYCRNFYFGNDFS